MSNFHVNDDCNEILAKELRKKFIHKKNTKKYDENLKEFVFDIELEN